MIGEFHIIRELGRGGMGIVYEADHASMGRRVALKVLPLRRVQDERLVERFQNEIRATARLEHDNIVPVFESGRSGDFCYYAMQFVRGQALDQVLAEVRRVRATDAPGTIGVRPATGEVVLSEVTERLLRHALEGDTDGDAVGTAIGEAPSVDDVRDGEEDDGCALPGDDSAAVKSGLGGNGSRPQIYHRSVARVGLQVAKALAYAHAEGIIHRDIKPSNLLLDASAKVWVTDFGLAKFEGSDVTHSGDVLGTVQYMPPERFRGWSDARGDIYSLGVTLYEMLAVRLHRRQSRRRSGCGLLARLEAPRRSAQRQHDLALGCPDRRIPRRTPRTPRDGRLRGLFPGR